MRIIGVDPGLTGGIALYSSGSYKLEDEELIIIEIPITKSLKGRGNEIVWGSIVDSFDLLIGEADHAFIERVQAMPQEGASSSFKFGYVAGGIMGIIASRRIPVTMVEPQKWKHKMGLGAKKDVAVARACQLFPKHIQYFKGPRGGDKDGPAEAALIAKYGHDVLLKPNE